MFDSNVNLHNSNSCFMLCAQAPSSSVSRYERETSPFLFRVRSIGDFFLITSLVKEGKNMNGRAFGCHEQANHSEMKKKPTRICMNTFTQTYHIHMEWEDPSHLYVWSDLSIRYSIILPFLYRKWKKNSLHYYFICTAFFFLRCHCRRYCCCCFCWYS